MFVRKWQILVLELGLGLDRPRAHDHERLRQRALGGEPLSRWVSKALPQQVHAVLSKPELRFKCTA